MEKIKCSVKLEGYDEIEMEFITMPNKGENISYNDEDFEIKTINHVVLDISPDNKNNNDDDIHIEKREEKKILIHASRVKRL